MEKIIYQDKVFVPFIEEDKIQSRVKELAAELTTDYSGKEPVFIGILNGAFMFMSDILKYYKGACEVDFFRISSYGDGMVSSGDVKLIKDINASVEGRDIIIVEDIVDSGNSMFYLNNLVKKQNPASLKILTLLFKPNSLKYDIKIDYIGFEIPPKFVIGYGLDLAQKYRNLPTIYALDE
jgi:hypoxanthine phosphoribosyltransferase